jgi:hypothetical protein
VPQRPELARLFIDRDERIRDDFFAEPADAVRFPDEESVHAFERGRFLSRDARRGGRRVGSGHIALFIRRIRGHARLGFLFKAQLVGFLLHRSDDHRMADGAAERAPGVVRRVPDLLAAARAPEMDFPVLF